MTMFFVIDLFDKTYSTTFYKIKMTLIEILNP